MLMTRRTATAGLTAGLLALMAGPVWSTATQPAFRRLVGGSFAELVAARRGQPFLLVLWSITCPPCRDEFTLLTEVLKSHPDLPLVLVCTDDVSEQALATTMLKDAGINVEESWIFADDAQKLRFEIDPDWYGELPRAYFYDSTTERKGISGRLTRQQVDDWLVATGQLKQAGR